ncbi:hypothetical protein JB92DRAFT_3113528 [Gautieria morchelliformis]|nr:hypothetical protein JB92DRAFT_3113528 [Gautieria morchelliformis]
MAQNTGFDYKQVSRTLDKGSDSSKRPMVESKAEEIIAPVVDTVPDIQKGIQALSTDPVLPNPIQAMSNAPIIANAIHILDQVSDLGKAMPFVAPAFVLLKFIIEVEKKARDADAKCSDLLERITFMLSHLPALKTVEIIKPTQLGGPSSSLPEAPTRCVLEWTVAPATNLLPRRPDSLGVVYRPPLL